MNPGLSGSPAARSGAGMAVSSEKSEGQTSACRNTPQEEIEAPPVSPQALDAGRSTATGAPDAPLQNQIQFDSLLDTLEQIGNGAVLLSAAGQAIALNPSARRHVGAGIALNRERVVASDPGSDTGLQALLRSLKPDRPRSGGRSIALARTNAPPLFAHVIQLDIDSNRRRARGLPRATLLCRRFRDQANRWMGLTSGLPRANSAVI